MNKLTLKQENVGVSSVRKSLALDKKLDATC
jgi:hypothetical protein